MDIMLSTRWTCYWLRTKLMHCVFAIFLQFVAEFDATYTTPCTLAVINQYGNSCYIIIFVEQFLLPDRVVAFVPEKAQLTEVPQELLCQM